MSSRSYAMLILSWARATFGSTAADPKERALRLLEEAAEYAQAEGLELAQCFATVRRTFGRPKGDSLKELGAVLVTAYACAGLHGNDPEMLLEDEIIRVLSVDPEHWRKKHDAKVDAGTAIKKVDVHSRKCRCPLPSRQDFDPYHCSSCGGKI